MGTFGHDKTDYSKEMYKAFKGSQAKRTSHAEKNYLKDNDIINKMNDPYLNVGFEREHYGGVRIKCAGSQDSGQNMQFEENWSHAGGTQVLPDGSKCDWCGATRNSYSGSNISTNIGPSDGVSANHVVTRSGNNDNQEYAKSGAKMAAGSDYHETGNDKMQLNGGKAMHVSARSKYGGMVGAGSHGISCETMGNKDYGAGSSSHNGATWLSCICQMGDGTDTHAVGKVQAASAPKGNYTRTVDKDGNRTITTVGDITQTSQGPRSITSKQGITHKAPTITLDGNVHITGELKTDKNIRSKGIHKAKAHV